MIKIVPELSNVFVETADEKIEAVVKTKMDTSSWFKPVPTTPLPLEIQEIPPTILIRKDDFKLYKYDLRYKNIEKVLLKNDTDYLDNLDRDMLILKHRKANVTTAPSPKWLNMSWDAFRHVDNHNKSHMF